MRLENPALSPSGKPYFRPDGYQVRPIRFADGVAFIEAHHYSHSAARAVSYLHGLFTPEGALVGVAWWMVPIRPAAVYAARICGSGDEKGVLNLSRLVIYPDQGVGAASWFLSASIRLIDRSRWPVLLTFADSGEGHGGQIYQATNWIYAGASAAGDTWVHKVTGEQRGRKRFDRTYSAAEMRAMGFEKRPPEPKHRYVRCWDGEKRREKKPEQTAILPEIYKSPPRRQPPVAPPVSTERPHARPGDGLTSVPHFEPPDWVMTPLLKAVQKHPELDVSNALIKATAWALARDSAKREQQLDVQECEQALLIAADLVAEGVDISANPLEIMYESLRRAHRADPRTAKNDAAFEAALAAEREDPSRQRPPRKGAKGGGRA